MPEGNTATASAGRTFTEGEAYALVDQAVKRETAGLADERDSLKTQIAEQGGRIDELETERNAAVARAEAAEKALADYQSEQAAKAEAEAKRAERTKAFAEANPYLEMTQERADRMVAMDDAAFAAYLEDMRELAGKVTPAEAASVKAGDPPRQSAAFAGIPTTESATKPGVGSFLAARRQMVSAAYANAPKEG